MSTEKRIKDLQGIIDCANTMYKRREINLRQWHEITEKAYPVLLEEMDIFIKEKEGEARDTK